MESGSAAGQSIQRASAWLAVPINTSPPAGCADILPQRYELAASRYSSTGSCALLKPAAISASRFHPFSVGRRDPTRLKDTAGQIQLQTLSLGEIKH